MDGWKVFDLAIWRKRERIEADEIGAEFDGSKWDGSPCVSLSHARGAEERSRAAGPLTEQGDQARGIPSSLAGQEHQPRKGRRRSDRRGGASGEGRGGAVEEGGE